VGEQPWDVPSELDSTSNHFLNVIGQVISNQQFTIMAVINLDFLPGRNRDATHFDRDRFRSSTEGEYVLPRKILEPLAVSALVA
jgi:hypothetical protein